MDVTKRLLEAVESGETAISFSGAVSVSLGDGVFKVGDWEGPEAEDAAAKVVEAMIAEAPAQEEPGDVVILAENVSLSDLIWVTKPYDKLADAPENIRELDGAKLTLAQVNWIANMADGLKGKKDIESPWAVAKAQFKKAFKKEGDKWTKPKEEKKKKEVDVVAKEVSLERVQDAFYNTFNPPDTVAKAGPSMWTKAVFPTFVVAEDAGNLYRVPYTTEDDIVKFAARSDWEQVELRYEPVTEGKEQSLDAILNNKEIDLQGKINSIESAFRKQMRPLPMEETAVEVISPRIVKLFDTYMITRIGQKHYRVSYTVDKDKGPQFAPRAEWAEVEQTWTPKGKEAAPPDAKFWRSKEARMLLAVSKAWLQRKESETVVWKEGDKRFYLGLISLAIKDKEGELVTMEGADFSIDLAQKYGYHSGLYIKHVVPQSLVGRSIRERRIGPFWVEFGEFKDTPLADWAYRVLENDGEGKWKFSIGFVTPKKQAKAGRYTRLLKFDSTITEKPAQPLTAMLVLMEGGTNGMENQMEKLMTFLNPETDEEKEQVTKMLADIFKEDKEMVTVAKDVGVVKAAIAGLEDEELKKKLQAALAGAGPKEKLKEKKKEVEVADIIAAAVTKALEPVLKRLDAVEASAGAAALAELRAALITRSRDLPKPSDVAVPVEDGAALIEKIEKLLDPTAGRGLHPLSSFAQGPASAEGG